MKIWNIRGLKKLILNGKKIKSWTNLGTKTK